MRCASGGIRRIQPTQLCIIMSISVLRPRISILGRLTRGCGGAAAAARLWHACTVAGTAHRHLTRCGYDEDVQGRDACRWMTLVDERTDTTR